MCAILCPAFGNAAASYATTVRCSSDHGRDRPYGTTRRRASLRAAQYLGCEHVPGEPGSSILASRACDLTSRNGGLRVDRVLRGERWSCLQRADASRPYAENEGAVKSPVGWRQIRFHSGLV